MQNHRRLFIVACFAVALSVGVPLACAHERDTFRIDNKYYVITVGSLNEPFVVDNMSGVDLRVSQVAGPDDKDAKGGKGVPVTGLERTLKVEVAAGAKRKIFSVDPSRTAPGYYAAPFIPTVQTTYSYRIFGTISGSLLDLTFSCMPGEASGAADDTSQVKLSDGVTRIHKVGAFGCPVARDMAGFPEPARSSYETNEDLRNLMIAAETANRKAERAEDLGILGLVAGLLGTAIAGMSWKRKRV